MSTKILKDPDDIILVTNVLHNKIKLYIIKKMVVLQEYSLLELWNTMKTDISISHRETFYKYIEDLVNANLLIKISNNGKIKYSKQYDSISIKL